jgi:hypothetical protein
MVREPSRGLKALGHERLTSIRVPVVRDGLALRGDRSWRRGRWG